MNKFFKLFGIIAMVAAIVPSMTACGGDDNGGNGGNGLLISVVYHGDWYMQRSEFFSPNQFHLKITNTTVEMGTRSSSSGEWNFSAHHKYTITEILAYGNGHVFIAGPSSCTFLINSTGELVIYYNGFFDNLGGINTFTRTPL